MIKGLTISVCKVNFFAQRQQILSTKLMIFFALKMIYWSIVDNFWTQCVQFWDTKMTILLCKSYFLDVKLIIFGHKVNNIRAQN